MESVSQESAGLPLVEELTPWQEPWQLCQHLVALPHLLFFDSAQLDASLGRYSFIAADPFLWLTAHSRQVESVNLAPGGATATQQEMGDPFTILNRHLASYRAVRLPGLPPFQGGAAGLFCYDLNQHIERLPRARYNEFSMPEMALGFYDWVIAFDHRDLRAWLISTGFPARSVEERLKWARKRRDSVHAWLERPPTRPHPARDPFALAESALAPLSSVEGMAGLRSDFSQWEYLQAVQRVLEYIHAGDCFQVNLAHRLLYPALLPPLELYRRLRERNPAPFAGYFDLGDFVLASASPERFLRVTEGLVETYPIKGTRPRGRTPAEDGRHRQELLSSVKDRAENVMIIDLLRNDLGRVCSYGSIEVKAVCRLESFRFVHHLVSEVHGRLRKDASLIDLLRATFPGGSVTGAPKVRAMEIIAELEPVSRGPYCGSLGYLGFDGSMDTNILIRTITHGRGWLQLPVGGGIVADSIPAAEYAETMHKAEGMLRALCD